MSIVLKLSFLKMDPALAYPKLIHNLEINVIFDSITIKFNLKMNDYEYV